MPPDRHDERDALLYKVIFSGPSEIANGMRVLVIGQNMRLGTGTVFTGSNLLAVAIY